MSLPVRLQKLSIIQAHYSEFLAFLDDAMAEMGFKVSAVQGAIARYMAYGPQYLMVQAQRGQAKTSIAAAYAVWTLIMDPTTRVLVISGGGTQAKEIATLCIRIIMNMAALECLRPDIYAGDRSSVEAFDVHHSLRGKADKSPSIKCAGITANVTGSRADLLIADDVEVMNNSRTAIQREQLRLRTLGFTNICSTGRILYLGTPQSEESIYNSLPSRGVAVRIWPGRYPTEKQREAYGDRLAPEIVRALDADPSLGTGGGQDGDQGKCLEEDGTGWLDEQNLQQKELDQGTTWFQLQHMLNTSLADALRFPIKLDKIPLMDVEDRAPLTFTKHPDPTALIPKSVHGYSFNLRRVTSLSVETGPLDNRMVYIDPAGGGQNADATAYACTAFHNGTVYLLESGHVPGGYSPAILEELAKRISDLSPHEVVIEKNFGFGAFKEVFQPILYRKYKAKVSEDMVHGQKERRIIDTIEPVVGRGALVITSRAIEQDQADCARHAQAQRQLYSLFFQLAKITRETNSLIHDDSADALEGAVRYWQQYLAVDEEVALEKAKERAYKEMTGDPLGHHRFESPKQNRGGFLTRRLGIRRGGRAR